MRIRDISTLPRRVQPVRHIINRKRRYREMQQHEDKLAMLLADMQKNRNKGK